MAHVVLSRDAVSMIRDTVASCQLEYPVLTVGRVPPIRDLRRAGDGKAQWQTVQVEDWFVHILGEEAPPAYPEAFPFSELPSVALRADDSVMALGGSLLVEVVNGQLAIAGIAT